MKKGWNQGLDNGPTGSTPLPLVSPRIGEQQRIGKNKDFYGDIAFGDNLNGQTTHAPGQVVRGGECIYDQAPYPKTFQAGKRWDKSGKSTW